MFNFLPGIDDITHFIAHPIDSIEGVGSGVVKFAQHPIDTTIGSVETKFNNSLNAIEHPLDTIEKKFDNVTKNFQEIGSELKKGINYFDEGVEYAWGSVIKPVFVDIYSLMQFGFNIIQWTVDHRYFVVAVGSSYFVMKYVNEVKKIVENK